jgi:myosin heavy subunit
VKRNEKTWLLLMTVHVHFQEYIQDGIDWARVDFEDNQDCLSLFEKVQNLGDQI